ncbi:MAG: carbohydrate kinase family protein [Verrucomicrobiae bacterium]|nr:carbohydrate kinase family protein [Verrucomicrobiae bacterium]
MNAPSVSRPIDVVVAGYLGVDLTPGFRPAPRALPVSDLFRPGRLIEMEGLEISLGGVVANTGLALRRFGQRVELMGCVGNDDLGDLAVARLKPAGVSGGIRRNSRARTACGIVLAPPGRDRLFLEDPGCNRDFTSNDIDFEVVGRSRIFHFGYPPLMDEMWKNGGAELRKLLERVKERRTMTSLDMSLPDPQSPAGKADWPAILANVLPFVDLFTPSMEELLFMLEPALFTRLASEAPGDDMMAAAPADLGKRLADQILAMGARALLIKAGSRGAYLRTGNPEALQDGGPFPHSDLGGCPEGVWIPPRPFEARRFRNACGAGDCAVAGFLAALLKGENLETSARFAMIAGRDNLYGSDAVSGLRDWTQMADEIRKTKNQP